MAESIIVAITGASGVIYGYRSLEILKQLGYATHLILSKAAKYTISQETQLTVSQFTYLADYVYDNHDFSAPIASGSVMTKGMVVAPCSIKTLSAIANSFTSNLISRAADVCLKEGRPLLLMVRETPLHRGHITLMLKVAKIGAILFPPIPAFYGNPQTLDEVVTISVGRALARMGIVNTDYPRWKDENVTT